MNRAMLMEQFLSIIKIFAQYNPDREIDYQFVYSQLINFGLGSLEYKEKLNDIWPQISSRVANVTDSNTVNWNNEWFLVFDRGQLNDNEIKMYLPAPKENIIDVVCTIERLLTENNIAHQLKVASFMRNDNIVIRVNSLDEAKLIRERINTSKLIDINPFLASDNGVGYAMDNNDSFNSVLSGLIASYIMDLRKQQKLNDVSLSGFRNFITREKEKLGHFNLTSRKLDLLDIYRLLELTTNPYFQIDDFYNFAIKKQVDKYNLKGERITNPEFYLEQAIKETNKKYPQNQGRALIEALQGNYMFFTNENFARDGLIKYVTPEIIKKIMQEKLQMAGFTIPDDENSLVTLYIKALAQENSYEVQYGIIRQAYVSTYEKYDYMQAHGALYDLVRYYRIDGFTDSQGYRTLLEQKVLGNNIINILRHNIANSNALDDKTLLEIAEKEFRRGIQLQQ